MKLQPKNFQHGSCASDVLVPLVKFKKWWDKFTTSNVKILLHGEAIQSACQSAWDDGWEAGRDAALEEVDRKDDRI